MSAATSFCRATLLLLAGCSRTGTPPAPPVTDWTVTAKAIGTTPLGQTPAEFAEAQHITGDLAAAEPECIYWMPHSAPAGLSFMIVGGRVVRADVDSTGIRTAKGIGIGSSIGEVEAAYGAALQSQPHKYNYDQGWRSLIAWESDSAAAIVFEVDSHSVRTLHAGLLPQVLYVERCS